MLKNSSKYIPMVIKNLDEEINSWKEGETVNNFNSKSSTIVLKIMTTILFGDDMVDKIED